MRRDRYEMAKGVRAGGEGGHEYMTTRKTSCHDDIWGGLSIKKQKNPLFDIVVEPGVLGPEGVTEKRRKKKKAAGPSTIRATLRQHRAP